MKNYNPQEPIQQESKLLKPTHSKCLKPDQNNTYKNILSIKSTFYAFISVILLLMVFKSIYEFTLVANSDGHIVALDKQNIPYYLNLDQWKFFRSGADHSIFSNINSESPYYKKVLIFTREKRPSNTDTLFLEKFSNELSQNILNNWIKPKIFVEVMSQIDQNKIKAWCQKNKIHKAIYSKFIITENLVITNHHNVIIQFKPRNPFPHLYSIQTIQQIANQLFISKETIQTILKTAPPREKTRWFKKCILREENLNGNPLTIFNIEINQIPNYADTTYYKVLPDNINKTKLNIRIHQLLHKEYQPLFDQLINKLQIYQKPFQFAWPEDKQISSSQFLSIPKVLNSSNSYTNLSKIYTSFIEQTCVKQKKQHIDEYWTNIYKLVVGFCFQDLSIMLKLQVNQNNEIMSHDLSLLDTQLKAVKHLKKLISHTKQALKAYIYYKLQIIELERKANLKSLTFNK